MRLRECKTRIDALGVMSSPPPFESWVDEAYAEIIGHKADYEYFSTDSSLALESTAFLPRMNDAMQTKLSELSAIVNEKNMMFGATESAFDLLDSVSAFVATNTSRLNARMADAPPPTTNGAPSRALKMLWLLEMVQMTQIMAYNALKKELTAFDDPDTLLNASRVSAGYSHMTEWVRFAKVVSMLDVEIRTLKDW